jgi:flagellin
MGDQVRALVARRLAQQGIDGTDLSGLIRGGPGLPSIGDARRGLGEVSGLLDQLKAHVNRLAAGKAATDDAQGVIDALIRNIDDASQRAGLGGFDGDGFSVSQIARQVTNLSVYNVRLAPGQEQEVEIDVRASAQQAGLFMDFADGVLDLGGATSSFTLEVGGRGGTRQLTFSSGTSAGAIAEAINAFAKQTGVEARLSGTGVRLESRATGSAELTSVRVIDDGGASDEAGRIYRFKADDAGAADPAGAMSFDSIIAHSGSGVRDKGQDAEVWVNGQKAAVYGSEVLASNDRFTALFYLDRAGAQQLGAFAGFTIRADGQIGPGDTGKGPRAMGADGVDPAREADGAGVVTPPPEGDYGSPPFASAGDSVLLDASGSSQGRP